jgi:hypothetical protein
MPGCFEAMTSPNPQTGMMPKPCWEQLPIFQLVAEHGVGDVVGGESEAIDLHQQRVGGQAIGIGPLRLDRLVLLQVVAGNDEVDGLHMSDPSGLACRDLCADGSMFCNSNIV